MSKTQVVKEFIFTYPLSRHAFSQTLRSLHANIKVLNSLHIPGEISSELMEPPKMFVMKKRKQNASKRKVNHMCTVRCKWSNWSGFHLIARCEWKLFNGVLHGINKILRCTSDHGQRTDIFCSSFSLFGVIHLFQMTTENIVACDKFESIALPYACIFIALATWHESYSLHNLQYVCICILCFFNIFEGKREHLGYLLFKKKSCIREDDMKITTLSSRAHNLIAKKILLLFCIISILYLFTAIKLQLYEALLQHFMIYLFGASHVQIYNVWFWSGNCGDLNKIKEPNP